MGVKFHVTVAASVLALALGGALSTAGAQPPGHSNAPDNAGPPAGAGPNSKNMRLTGHEPLQGRSAYKGHVQQQGDRFIAYVGHHGGEQLNPLTGNVEPNGLSIVDVTDPKNPVYLHHLLPTQGDQSRNLLTCAGDDLPGAPSGTYWLLSETDNEIIEVWDVTTPENPTLTTTVVDNAQGTHKNWWECDTGIAYLNVGIPGWDSGRHMQIFDLSDPTDPVFIRNYGVPGTPPGEDPTGLRLTGFHEFLERDGFVYGAHGTSSNGVLTILDRERLLNDCDAREGDPCATNPTNDDLEEPIVTRFNTPSDMGVHTAVPYHNVETPQFSGFNEGATRDFVTLVNESTGNECDERFYQMFYIADITDAIRNHPDSDTGINDESGLSSQHDEDPYVMPVDNYFVHPDEGDYCNAGGRFGAHAQQWNLTDIYHKRIAWVSWFNAGVRGVDVRDPYNLEEVAYFVPQTTENTQPRDGKIAIQTNNVDVDDRGFIYTFDRAGTGMHILEVKGKAKQIANFD